ncbi:MAG TPA: alpha/beta fold hydrolase [Actinomycetota bacterium]|nr:alpha/beta fold hydrolase [Actinomycetota bacterium]
MEIPFFLPTSAGDLSAIASLPDDGVLHGPSVFLLPGDSARNRVGVLRDVARRVADNRQPVMRFDYPGHGFSPIDATPTRKDLIPIIVEAMDWFSTQTGLTDVAVAGTCLGARAAVMLAAADDRVTTAVSVGCPIRKRKPVKPKVRAGLAAIDAIGGRVASHLARGSRTKTIGEGWQKGLVEDILTAAPRARVEFVFGELDEFYADFRDLMASGDIPEEVRDELTVTVLPGEQLRGLMSVEHHSWVVDVLVESLTSRLSPVSHDG